MLLPAPAQRLLAFIALRDRPVLRSYAAETLWLESTQEHALGSLRSALWRLRRPCHDVVQMRGTRLSLEPRVVVDVRVLVGWAHSVLDAPQRVGSHTPGVIDVSDAVLGDLLPDWYDDWLVVERERLREPHPRARARLRAADRVRELRAGDRGGHRRGPCGTAT